MQNAQNTDIQRVMNLVDLYRTKMYEKHTTQTQDLSKHFSKEEIDCLEKNGEKVVTKAYIGIDRSKVEFYFFNEQLLGHFYAIVAGSDAKKDVLQQLLPDFYDTTIFTQEEETFMMEHFPEMVNYIIRTPLNDWHESEEDNHDSSMKKDFLIPEEIITLIKSRVDFPSDSTIYSLFLGLGQLPVHFNSKMVLWSTDDVLLDYEMKMVFDSIEESFCVGNKQLQAEEKAWIKRISRWCRSYAWAQVAMYANKVNTQLVQEGDYTFSYDVLMTYIPYSSKVFWGIEMIKKTHEVYDHLNENGKMILLCPSSFLWSDTKEESIFRKQLVEEGSIVEVIQLPNVMCSDYDREFCIIIAEKGCSQGHTTFIDARTAFKKKNVLTSYKERVWGFWDMNVWNALLQNNGIEQDTGLRKMVAAKSVELNPQMLLPQIYVLEKPAVNEHPASLSKLCHQVITTVRMVKQDLPIDTPWIKRGDLSHVFQGALTVSTLEKANCSNNPPHTEDYKFNEKGDFIDEKAFKSPFMSTGGRWLGPGQQTEIGRRVVDYRNCTFIDGTKDAVLYKQNDDEVCVALVRATGKPIAIEPGIKVFIPNENIDALSLVALLKLPIVYRQIRAYEKFGLSNYMDDILVPTDLRIIRDEERRLKDEQETYKTQQEKFESMKTEYINEVRMRKHDMRPHMKQLNSAKNLMQYYVENMDSIPGVQELLNNQIRRFSSALEYLSDLVEHFSDEEQFGEPERFDLHDFLSHIGERHGTEKYVIKYECDIISIIDYNIHRQKELDNYMINQEIEDAIAQQEMDDYLINQEIEDAIAQQEMDDYLINQEIEDAIAQQEMDDYLINQEIEDAIAQQEIEDSFEGEEAYVFDETQVNDEEPYMMGESQVVDDEAYVFEETQVDDDEPYMVGESQVVDDEAYVFEETQVDDDEPYIVDESQVVDDEAYVMDGVWGKHLTSIPQSYIAPNDIQRLVDNILNNAWKHGFENSERNDHEVNVKLSIDTKRNMFQIDFRNNGNPLPGGMDKMRYGLLGEKAGKTGGTGIGGNYVKKFVEHYGGDYDVFMENGWVVIRIYLPIK